MAEGAPCIEKRATGAPAPSSTLNALPEAIWRNTGEAMATGR
jgi:hypothetical protein